MSTYRLPFGCYEREKTPTILILDDGKEIILDTCNSGNKIRGIVPQVHTLSPGVQVEIFAKKDGQNEYTLFGSNDYYVKIIN